MFSTNPLENVGAYMREGVQRFGEDLMGQAINHVLANQDATLNQIQELQKWNIVKFVQKLINSKFFPREKPVTPIADSQLLCGLLGNKVHPASYEVGNISVQANAVEALYVPSLRSSESAKKFRRIRWKVRAKTLHRQCETAAVTPQPTSGTNWTRANVQETQNDENSYDSSLRWTGSAGTLDLGPFYDVQSDIQIELLKQKVPEDKRAAADQTLTELSGFFGEPTSARTEDEKLPASDWIVHGRVIIPIALILSTASVAQTDTTHCSDDKSAKQLITALRPAGETHRVDFANTPAKFAQVHVTKLPSNRIQLTGWYHLYPPAQQEEEFKFVRPCSGYPGLGMINPIVSLGFVELTVTLDLVVHPLLLPLISNLNPPEAVWTISTKFDLQAFEVGGLRMHHLQGFVPRWIRRFCHPVTLYKTYGGEQLSILCIFWSILIFITVFARIVHVPFLATALVLLVSFSYKLHPSDTTGTTIYSKPPPPTICELHPECNGKAIASALGARGSRTSTQILDWMNSSVLDLSNPRGLPRPRIEQPKVESVCPPVASLMLAPTDVKPSVLGTIFGRADILVRDATAYVPTYPLFADDVGDVDILTLKHMGLMVLESVQLMATMGATIIEKVKFALDWTDPWITLVTWCILIVGCLQTSLILYVLSYLPQFVLRALFILAPLTASLVLTDPQLLIVTGLAAKMDQLAMKAVVWQPESNLILRMVQNLWDSFYLQYIITTEERNARFQAVQDLLSSQTNTTEPGTTPRSQPNYSVQVERQTVITATTPVTDGLRQRHTSAVQSTAAVVTMQESEQPTVWRESVKYQIIEELLSLTLNVFILKPLFKLLKWELKYLYYWCLRIPDRREIEHRQIAATQFMGDKLEAFIPTERLTAEGVPLPTPRKVLAAYFETAVRDLTVSKGKPEPSPRVSEHQGSPTKAVLRPFKFAEDEAAWYTTAKKNVEAVFKKWDPLSKNSLTEEETHSASGDVTSSLPDSQERGRVTTPPLSERRMRSQDPPTTYLSPEKTRKRAESTEDTSVQNKSSWLRRQSRKHSTIVDSWTANVNKFLNR